MWSIKSTVMLKVGLLSSVFCLSLESNAKPIITSVNQDVNMVELTVVDTDGFSVGALPHVLKVGDFTFKRSRSPEDGNQDTLIFLIPSEDFEKLNEDDLVDLGYGEKSLSEPVQDFPDKSSMSAEKQSNDPARSKRKWALGKFKKSELTKKKNN